MLERLSFQPSAGFDSLIFARLKADTENRKAKPDDGLGLSCEICGGGGYLLDVREDGALFSKPCQCAPMRETRARLKSAGLLERSRTSTFAAFETAEPWQKRMLDTTLDFCQAEKPGWLMLCGQPGCGKTHLCVAAVGEIAKRGYPVQVLPWVDTMRRLKDFEDGERNREFRRYKAAPVLYIDDFLKGTPGKTEMDAAFELLNERYNQPEAVTLISSELTPDELGQRDPAIRGRIVERCGKHLCVIRREPGRDHRLRRESG